MCGSVKEKVRLANLKWISKDRSNWMQAQRESQIISCPQATGKMWKVIWCVLHWGVQCCNSIDTQAALLRNRTGQRLKQGDKLGDYSKNNERDDDDLSQGGNICMYWLLATCLSTRSRCLRAQLTALSSGKFFPLPSIKVILDYVAVIHLQFSPASWANPHVNQALTFAFFFSWWDRTPPPPTHTHRDHTVMGKGFWWNSCGWHWTCELPVPTAHSCLRVLLRCTSGCTISSYKQCLLCLSNFTQAANTQLIMNGLFGCLVSLYFTAKSCVSTRTQEHARNPFSKVT